jgi:hypothetical protein
MKSIKVYIMLAIAVLILGTPIVMAGGWGTSGTGSGDVTGPGSSTDNAITRFNGAGGDTIQNSTATLSDAGTINIPAGQEYQIDGTALAPGDIGAEVADGTILKEADVDDVPVDSVTTAPVSSNWAYDHANASNPHSITADGILPSQTGNSGKFLTTDGTNSSWGTPAGSGDVVGPGSAVDDNFATFDTTTGKLIQDSGYSASSFEPADADITKADVAETITEPWSFTGGLTTGSSATPTVTFKDSDCTDDDVNAQIQANATDTGSGTEDIDLAISTQKAGAMTEFIGIDADATNPVSILGYDIPQTYTVQATITEPDQLAASDKLIIWKNTTGSTFTITAIYAISDVDDTDFVLDEYDADGASNTQEIDAVQCVTGSGPYTVDITSGITHTTIEDGHVIAFDADASDTPGYIFFAIKGHF